MARSRFVRPGFFEDEDLDEVSDAAKLLFICLWQQADREGRLQYKEKWLKTKFSPYKERDIIPLLGELAHGDKQFIQLYEVEGRQYIYIINFVKQQKPHKNEPASELPPPPKGNKRLYFFDIQTPEPSGAIPSPPEPAPEPKPRAPRLVFDPLDEDAARWMLEKIRLIMPNFKQPRIEAWANEIRIMRQADKRTHEEIREVFDFANKHHFWGKNILSPQSLRKQWDKLIGARLSAGSKPAPQGIKVAPPSEWQGGFING
jgi:hypothetical protein